jgi:hypothetical protein
MGWCGRRRPERDLSGSAKGARIAPTLVLQPGEDSHMCARGRDSTAARARGRPRANAQDMPTPRAGSKRPSNQAGTNGAAGASVSPPESLVTIVSPESQTAIQAILVGGEGWKRRTRRAPTFGDERGTYVSLGDPNAKLSSEQEELAWRRVLQLDDQTALTFVYIAARYLAQNDDPGVRRSVRVHVNELLEYRGYTRHRTGDFRSQHKIEERDRLANLADMRVSTPVADAKRKNPRAHSNLLNVTYYTEDKQQQLTFVDGEPTQVPYAFDIDLGSWAAPAIAASGAKRAILASIMRYDPADAGQRMGMRLALYLHFRSSSVSSVGELIEGANIKLPAHHPERFRDDFEKAMDLLRTDDVIADWVYVRETELPRYRWLDIWLTWDVAIRQAPSVIVGRSQPQLPADPGAKAEGTQRSR